MKTLEQLKKEATERGIVEGATIRTAWRMHDTRTAIVPSPNEWILHGNTDLTFRDNGDDVWIKDLDSGRWATVITPAPSKEEGLVHGDAVECGPAMRAAIVELAKELKLDMTVPAADTSVHKKGMSWVKHGFNEPRLHRWNYQESFHRPHTPEEFIRKMRITAAFPKPEPPILIESDGENYQVQFRAGDVKIGCTVIDNATVRLIASKLID